MLNTFRLFLISLAFFLQLAALHGQSQMNGNFTIESVLRAVQQRKQMLAVRDSVINELSDEAEAMEGDNGSSPTGGTKNVQVQELIKWGGGLASFPENGDVKDLKTAINALNTALAVFYSVIQPAYCTYSSDQITIGSNDAGIAPNKQPCIQKFTEDNWRENLRLFASQIDQMKGLYWPTLNFWTSGSLHWWNIRKKENGENELVDLASGVFSSPASFGTQVGTCLAKCSKGESFSIEEAEVPFFQWTTQAAAYQPDEGEPNGWCFSTVKFVTGLKTKLLSASSGNATADLSGTLRFYAGASMWPVAVGGTADTLNDGLRKSTPHEPYWDRNYRTKIDPSVTVEGHEVTLGDTDSEDYPDSDNSDQLKAIYESMREVFSMPEIDTSEGVWEAAADNESSLTLKFNPISYRFKHGAFTEAAALNFCCIHYPDFTPVTPIVVRNMGGGNMDYGVVELLPRRNEPVRIHLGRGSVDRQQTAWLSSKLDGFGTLDFTGSLSAFEVLYEFNPDNYSDAPFSLNSSDGGNPRDMCYERMDEFPDPPEGSDIPSDFSSRWAYLMRWYKPRLRQVKGGDVLANVQYISGFRKKIDFYWASDFTSKQDDGFYSVEGLTPFKSLTIQNPSAQNSNTRPEDYSTLRVRENDVIQHDIQEEVIDANHSRWSFVTASDNTSYNRTRIIEYDYDGEVTHWSEDVTEGNGDAKWNTSQEYVDGWDPNYTDYPILASSSTTTQAGGGRSIEMSWQKVEQTNPNPDVIYCIVAPQMYWNPQSLSLSEGNGLNPSSVSFDPNCYGLVTAQSCRVMGLTHEVGYARNVNSCTITSSLAGSAYKSTSLVYSDQLQTVTFTTGSLETKYKYGAPDSSMPWVLTRVEGPDTWRQDFSHTFAAETTSSTVTSGYGTNYQGGTMSLNIVNRMGGLISQATSLSDSTLVISKTTGSDFTDWGQPKTLTYLDGRTEQATFNTDSPDSYGTLATATDIFGRKITVNGYDDLKRPSSINTGFETLTPSYSNPLSPSFSSSAGYTQTSQLDGFGQLKTMSNTQGSGVSLSLSGQNSSLIVGGRTISLEQADSGEILEVGSGLGSRGSRVELSVSGGRLCKTVTQLNQSNNSSQPVKMYYDSNGRLVQRDSYGPDGAMHSESWGYPDTRTVVYTPGPGPVLKPVTRTLSSDGLTLTTTVGTRETTRQTRSVQDGQLVMVTQINDDSGGQGDVWTTVSTQKLDPASGASSFTPWDLSTESATQMLNQGEELKQITSTAGSDSSTVILSSGLPTGLSGTVDGISYNFQNISWRSGRLTGANGTIAGQNVSFSLDDDGLLSGLTGPGFNKSFTYSGNSGYQVTVSDSAQGSSQTLTSSAVGDFTGISGNGVQPVSASTTDTGNGMTSTTVGNFGLTISRAADGSVLSKNYNGGMEEKTEYGADGLLKSMGVGPESKSVSYDNDGLTRNTSGSGYNVDETFYHAGLRSGVSGGGEARSFKYQRRVLAEENHTNGPWAGTTVSYGQDDHGRPGSLSVGNLFSVAYGYHGGTSRLESVRPFGGGGATFGLYTDSGRRHTMQRGTLGTTWGRDDLGRETSVTTGTQTFGYSYDDAQPGHPLKTRTVSGGTGWTNMKYDSAGRLTNVLLSDGTPLLYQYDARGNRWGAGRQISETQSATTFGVSSLNRLDTGSTDSSILGYGVYGSLKKADGTVAAGARVRVRMLYPQATDPDGGEDLAVAADGSYHGWWTATASGGGVTRVQLLVRGTLPGAGSLINGGPTMRDAVTEEAVWTVIPASSETFIYDDAGRLTDDGTWHYDWNTGGRLTGLTRKPNTAADPAVTAETIGYSYDSDGRRTGRTHSVSRTGQPTPQVETSKVLWDGWLPVCEERTVNGVALARRWFVWGPDVSGSLGGAGGIGGLVSIKEEGGRILLPVDDGLGNITAVIDQATGNVIARYDYAPYGEDVGKRGEVDACPFRYQSKWWDADAGLYYFGYRHYSPRLGRWLSRDPLGEDGGMNLYAYCEGDPVNKYDYLGMDARSAKAAVEDAEKMLGAITMSLAQAGEMASKGQEALADIYFEGAASSYDAYQSKLTLAQTEINSWRTEAWFASTGPMNMQARLDALPITPAPGMAGVMSDRFFQQSSSGSELTSDLWDIQSETLTERAGRAQNIQLTADVAGLALGIGGGAAAAFKEGGRRALIGYLAKNGALAGGSIYAFSKGREFAVANGATEEQLFYADTGMRLFALWALTRPSTIKRVSKQDGIPSTGVDKYDQLAVESRYFDRFIRGVKSRNFVVRSNPNLFERANLVRGRNKMIFEYNPNTFNLLDMLHEIKHFNQFKRLGRSMFKDIPAMEREAYGFELEFGRGAGFSSEYLDWALGRFKSFGGN